MAVTFSGGPRGTVINLHHCLPGGTKSSLATSPACEDAEKTKVRGSHRFQSLRTPLNPSNPAHHLGIPGVVVVARPDKDLWCSHLVRARTWAPFSAADPLAAAGQQM